MITLRPAEPRDTAAIGRLFSMSRRLLTFLPELHTPEEDLAFIAGEIIPRYRITVALRDGVLAGYMAEGPQWIEQLYLLPDARRSGLGSTLLRDAQSRQDRLELWCFAQNAPARAFYEKHGFVPLYETDGAGNEAGAPDVRYRWDRSGGT